MTYPWEAPEVKGCAICRTCGYSYPIDEIGGHSCAEYLRKCIQAGLFGDAQKNPDPDPRLGTHQRLLRRLKDVHPDDLSPWVRRLRRAWVKDGSPGLRILKGPYAHNACLDEGCDECPPGTIPRAERAQKREEDDLMNLDEEFDLLEEQIHASLRTERVHLRIATQIVDKLRAVADHDDSDPNSNGIGYKTVLNQVLRTWFEDDPPGTQTWIEQARKLKKEYIQVLNEESAHFKRQVLTTFDAMETTEIRTKLARAVLASINRQLTRPLPPDRVTEYNVSLSDLGGDIFDAVRKEVSK